MISTASFAAPVASAEVSLKTVQVWSPRNTLWSPFVAS